MHADVNLISTSRHKFIDKCNVALPYMNINSLSTNKGKNAYMIINPREGDLRTDIRLNNFILNIHLNINI